MKGDSVLLLAPQARKRRIIQPTRSSGVIKSHSSLDPSASAFNFMTSNTFSSKLLNSRMSKATRSTITVLEALKTTSQDHHTRQHHSHRIKDSTSAILDAYNEDSQIIRIKCLSNWGHPSKIGLSSLTLLDKERRKIPVTHCFITPLEDGNTSSHSLERLFDPVLVKENEENIWTTDFPLEEGKELIINLIIPDNISVHSIRFWNPQNEPEQGLRTFQILRDREFILSDDVPFRFGLNCQLPLMEKGAKVTKDSLLLDLLRDKPDQTLSDSYGNYPLVATKTIKIQILSTYETEPTENFGLNGLSFFNQKKEELKPEEFADISISGCGFCSSMSTILRPNKVSDSSLDMFIADTKWNPMPTLTISFKNPTKISKIHFWNYNSVGQFRHCGVQFVKILNDFGPVWSGKIHEATGNVNGIRKNITVIPFTDLPGFNEDL